MLVVCCVVVIIGVVGVVVFVVEEYVGQWCDVQVFDWFVYVKCDGYVYYECVVGVDVEVVDVCYVG